jgi:cbb3-type cytochrome oxidase subunit 3
MQLVVHIPWEWSLFHDGDAYYLLVVCDATTLTDVVIALSAAEIAAWQQTKMMSMVALAHLVQTSSLPHPRHRADIAAQLRPLRAATMDIAPLLHAIDSAGVRMNRAALVTSVLCAGLAWLMTQDASIWVPGTAWYVGAIIGVSFFVLCALVGLYYAFRGQRTQFAQLKQIVIEHPQQIRDAVLMVARGKPPAWVADDGTATRGLHVVVTSHADQTWVLPVAREMAARVMYLFAQRGQLAR